MRGMGDKNPKKGKNVKKKVVLPAVETVEKVEPEMIRKKKKPM